MWSFASTHSTKPFPLWPARIATIFMPPIADPFVLLVCFIVMIGALFWLAALPRLAPVFHYVPPVLWILLIPMTCSTLGLTPHTHPLYDWLRNYVLVAALVLLLLATNVRAIWQLGRTALLSMLAASFGVALGAVIAFWLLHRWLPAEAWKAVGPLMGVWIGGYGNMLAVGASIEAPASMMTNAIITDTVVGFGWMALLLWLAPFQDTLDRRLGADRAVLEDLNQRLAQLHATHDRPMQLTDFAIMLALAFGVACVVLQAGKHLPVVAGILSPFTWSVILATLAGIGLSFSRLARLQYAGATPVGTFLLYLAYAAIGAQANLRGLAEAPQFLLFGMVVLILHAALLLVVGRLLRAPLFLLATASQANIGGMATAPIVASVYQSSLAGVAVLMVPLGLAYGTFVALLVAGICRRIAE